MANKRCPQCESRGGMNMMKGEVTQLFDPADISVPKTIDYTCGFCGYEESEETFRTSVGGMKTTVTVPPPPAP